MVLHRMKMSHWMTSLREGHVLNLIVHLKFAEFFPFFFWQECNETFFDESDGLTVFQHPKKGTGDVSPSASGPTINLLLVNARLCGARADPHWWQHQSGTPQSRHVFSVFLSSAGRVPPLLRCMSQDLVTVLHKWSAVMMRMGERYPCEEKAVLQWRFGLGSSCS